MMKNSAELFANRLVTLTLIFPRSCLGIQGAPLERGIELSLLITWRARGEQLGSSLPFPNPFSIDPPQGIDCRCRRDVLRDKKNSLINRDLGHISRGVSPLFCEIMFRWGRQQTPSNATVAIAVVEAWIVRLRIYKLGTRPVY